MGGGDHIEKKRKEIEELLLLLCLKSHSLKGSTPCSKVLVKLSLLVHLVLLLSDAEELVSSSKVVT